MQKKNDKKNKTDRKKVKNRVAVNVIFFKTISTDDVEPGDVNQSNPSVEKMV